MATTIYNNSPSEGEEYLADFFEWAEIKYETEKKIENLKYDTKLYRTADFYLPKYKVFVEFFGRWNNEGNEEYRQKKEIYWRNKIPCVYIYPENLGIIGYSFDKRIQVVLEKFKLKEELIKYKRYKLFKSGELRNRISILAICFFLIGIGLFSYGLKNVDWSIMVLVLIVGVYQVMCLFELYMDIFKRNKYSLDEL